jgi:hypothetical protein
VGQASRVETRRLPGTRPARAVASADASHAAGASAVRSTSHNRPNEPLGRTPPASQSSPQCLVCHVRAGLLSGVTGVGSGEVRTGTGGPPRAPPAGRRGPAHALPRGGDSRELGVYHHGLPPTRRTDSRGHRGDQRTPKGGSARIHVCSMDAETPPPKGRTRCLTPHTISPIGWPPALLTRPIDATTTTEVTRPAIRTSSRSSTSADEPSRSATTVAETQASFPSAMPTGWLQPTARKRTGTSTPSSPRGSREPTSLLRSARSGASPPQSLLLNPAEATVVMARH